MNTSATMNDKTFSDLTETPDHASLEELREQAKSVGFELRALGEAGLSAAEEEIENAKLLGQEAVDTAKDKAEVWERRAAYRVREEPLKSLAYAAGAGVLLGLFLRR